MSQVEALLAELEPFVARMEGIDLSDPREAERLLGERLPLEGEQVAAVRRLAEEGAREGWLLPKENQGVRFGRVSKDLRGFSVDAVLMSGPGPRHRHPGGEIDLCFVREGQPRFDGRDPGWVVYGPDSVHVPTVRGGEMLILYFLPGGQMEFLRD